MRVTIKRGVFSYANGTAVARMHRKGRNYQFPVTDVETAKKLRLDLKTASIVFNDDKDFKEWFIRKTLQVVENDLRKELEL